MVVIELTASGRLAAGTVRQALAELEEQALGGSAPESIAGFHTVLRALAEVSA